MATGLFTGSNNRNELHGSDEVCVWQKQDIYSLPSMSFNLQCSYNLCNFHDLQEEQQPPTRQSVVPKICRICSDEVGLKENGDPFVACHECRFPVCRPCYEYERSEGNQCCPQCQIRYKRHKGSFSLFLCI